MISLSLASNTPPQKITKHELDSVTTKEKITDFFIKLMTNTDAISLSRENSKRLVKKSKILTDNTFYATVLCWLRLHLRLPRNQNLYRHPIKLPNTATGNQKAFFCPKEFLVQNTVLQPALEHGFQESEKKELELSSLSVDSQKAYVDYLFTLNLSKPSLECLVELIIFSHEIADDDLAKLCWKKLQVSDSVFEFDAEIVKALLLRLKDCSEEAWYKTVFNFIKTKGPLPDCSSYYKDPIQVLGSDAFYYPRKLYPYKETKKHTPEHFALIKSYLLTSQIPSSTSPHTILEVYLDNELVDYEFRKSLIIALNKIPSEKIFNERQKEALTCKFLLESGIPYQKIEGDISVSLSSFITLFSNHLSPVSDIVASKIGVIYAQAKDIKNEFLPYNVDERYRRAIQQLQIDSIYSNQELRYVHELYSYFPNAEISCFRPSFSHMTIDTELYGLSGYIYSMPALLAAGKFLDKTIEGARELCELEALYAIRHKRAGNKKELLERAINSCTTNATIFSEYAALLPDNDPKKVAYIERAKKLGSKRCFEKEPLVKEITALKL